MENPIITIQREESTDDGTYGILRGAGLTLQTLELPWCGNERGHSCIPAGQYTCKVTFSNKFRRDYYELLNVPGRGGVRIHSGNFAGDVRKGLQSDVEGCILLGMQRGVVENKNRAKQKAVLESKKAVALFMETLRNQDFVLRIL